MASPDRTRFQIGKRPGQSVQSSAHDPDVVRIVQVCGQGNLRRLVLHVAPQVCARPSRRRSSRLAWEKKCSAGLLVHSLTATTRPCLSGAKGCPKRWS